MVSRSVVPPDPGHAPSAPGYAHEPQEPTLKAAHDRTATVLIAISLPLAIVAIMGILVTPWHWLFYILLVAAGISTAVSAVLLALSTSSGRSDWSRLPVIWSRFRK